VSFSFVFCGLDFVAEIRLFGYGGFNRLRLAAASGPEELVEKNEVSRSGKKPPVAKICHRVLSLSGRLVMNHSLKTGLSFGLTSGIITTLGLMVGLHSGTHSRLAVIGGILTIAIADAFSDALGIHVSEESENKHTSREIWEATACTFVSKFVFALTFLVPVLALPLTTALVVSVAWGLSLLAVFSFYLAKEQGEKPWRVAGEHLLIAAVVIVITHLAGEWISSTFS
jgi:VIT1/CCC1 family predicted Fe2+/Mn2+ transporter